MTIILRAEPLTRDAFAPFGEFLIIDRKGPGSNLEEHWFPEGERPTLTE